MKALPLLLFFPLLLGSCTKADIRSASASGAGKKAAKATFIELGSVRCIPCQKMQLVMREVQQEYADQVEILFYDVWTDAGRPYARQYRIRVIPTQVFLDKDGREYFRHEGYFPKEELLQVLRRQGVK